MQLGITCFAGLSDLLEQEAHDLGWSEARAVSDELVIGPSMSEGFPSQLASRLRLARRVIRLIHHGQFDGIDAIRTACEQLDWASFLDASRSFGVLCERYGHHDFTSEELGRELGSCARRWFVAHDLPKPPVNLKAPQQALFAILRHRDFFLGIDLAGEIDRRLTRLFQHHAPLNPTLALGLLQLSSFATTRCVLDPMCGTGTIAIEAAMYARRLPAEGGQFRIIAGERFKAPFAGMRENLAAFKVDDLVEPRCGDATTLDYLEPGSCPLIVTNPPYGLRIGKPHEVDELYRRFALAAADRDVREIVAITTRKHSWDDSMIAAGYELAHMRAVTYGRLAAWIMIHRK